jgi:formylglycine-generating enzyme required for sulfatase activity
LAVDEPAANPATVPLPTTKVNSKDRAEMILIPAGDFLMGSTDADKQAQNNEKPQRKVYLDAYYMYKTEVTVAQYRKFCTATNRTMPPEPDWKWQDIHPIVNVSWNDAKAYADWAGVVLPTEAQWEKAARGGDGRIYPWGNEWDETKCAYWSNSGKGKTTRGTHTVGSFPTGASPYGVMDMSGNVWEWCADWYRADYYKNASVKNPTGPLTGDNRVLRGGSWYSDYGGDNYYRGAYRIYGGSPYYYYSIGVGFRCASPGQ